MALFRICSRTVTKTLKQYCDMARPLPCLWREISCGRIMSGDFNPFDSNPRFHIDQDSQYRPIEVVDYSDESNLTNINPNGFVSMNIGALDSLPVLDVSRLLFTSHYLEKEKLRSGYPIQFKLLYATEKKDERARAMEILWKQDQESFIVDIWRTGLFHSTATLPDELVNLKNWNAEAWKQLKNLVIDMMKDLKLDDNNQWHLTKGEDEFQAVQDSIERGERLSTKYGLPHSVIQQAMIFRQALLTKPMLGNTFGRAALLSICSMLIEIMPLPYSYWCYPFSVGGSARTWIGNCQIGYTFENKKMADVDLRNVVEQRDCKWNTQMWAPDLTVASMACNTIYITGEVKTSEETRGFSNAWHARRQAWEQGLRGLYDKDETSALLLTPTEAEVYQLRLVNVESKPGRFLHTNTKQYSFVDPTVHKKTFSTDVLLQFISDIMGLMFRGLYSR